MAILGSGIVFLDGSIVTVALPAIGAELPVTTNLGTLEAQSYVYSAYLLSLSALLIAGGALSDSRGRRRMFAWGLGGFAVASALCGLAPTMEFLIGARALKGAAGALVVPGSLAIINAAFEGEARARAFGLWTGASAGVTVLGPLIGGGLVDGVSWRAAFLVNLPILAFALWATLQKVEESARLATGEPIDWYGAALTGLAVAGLTFGPIRGQEAGWTSPVVVALLVVGVGATVAVVLRVRNRPHALVPRSLFENRTFVVVNISTFFIYGALYVVLYMLSIHLQGTLGYTATAAGFASVPAMVLLALFSGKVGGWSERTGPRAWLTLGPLAMAGGAVWLSFIPPTSEAWRMTGTDLSTWVPPSGYLSDVLGGVVLFGLGAMIMVAPLTAALMGSVPHERAGVGSAFNNAVSRIGPQLAGALAVVATTAVFYGALAERAPGLDVSDPMVRAQVSPLNSPAPGVGEGIGDAAREASSEAFSWAMWIGAALLVVGAGANGVGLAARVGVPGDVEGVRLGGQICVPLDVDATG
ncbi:MFS transporter [soil metagenome]